MSDDNLESLDNASLRKKCLEYGLPNVPVTDTSRPLLIRRLRAAMTGESADKAKNRRKTIHTSKIPSPVETAAPVAEQVVEAPKPGPGRPRRTIAAPSVTSTVDDAPLQQTQRPDSATDKRRSVRSTYTEENSTHIPVSQKRKTAVLEEDEDEDDDVILLEAAEKSEREIVIPRTRRSVSLTKTGVVTTSYSQEVVAPPTVNETESESENDFVTNYASSYEPLTRPLAQQRTSYGFTQPTLSQQTRETEFGFAQPAQPKPRESAYEFTQPQLPQDKPFGLSQRKSSELDPTLSFRTTTVNRTSIEPEPSFKPSLYSSTRYSSLGSGGHSESSTTTSTSTIRRYTTTGLGAKPAPVATKYTSSYNNDDEDEENEAPYLSDFARKLERLKAEPLTKGLDSPRGAPLKRETRYTSNIVGRRSTSQKDSVSESFKNLFIALDRKYHLKRNIAIAFVVILMLFVYVVFIR